MNTLVIFAIVIACVSAENCHEDSDCTITVCGANFRPDCYKRDDSHVCTCVPTSSSGGSSSTKCTSADQCKAAHGDCNSADHKWHCIDTQCRCGWRDFFGGIGR